MKRKFKIGLNGDGIADLIDALNEYPAWLEERSKELLFRLSQEGYQIAAAGFGKAQYDGVNDSAVSVENRGENVRAVVALGSAVLFIEFGTGDMAGATAVLYDQVPTVVRPSSWSETHSQQYSTQGFWYFGGKMYRETVPHPAFYYAYQAMVQALPQIVSEEFKA